MYSDPRYHDTLGIILKALVGIGIVIVTVSMILLFVDALSSTSLFLQLMVAGGVVMSMAFLSLRIFERM